jgi:hypothetical protein
MTTSEINDYNVTGQDIIKESLGIVGVYSPGEAIPSTESADALRTLEMMLKSSKFKGLWLNRELSLFLADDTVSYSIGPTGTHCAANAVKTEVATAASSGASSIVIDSTTDFGDTFDRNGLVEATTPSGSGTVTLTGALVSSGIATLSSDRKILIYSDGDESGVTFAVTGTNGAGVAVTENITGPNTTTVYSSSTYKKISSITIDGAGTGNIEIGQVGDHVGIELDDGTVQWTYIVAALSTTLTLLDSLTDDVAVDKHIYSYTTKTSRPSMIVEARRVMPAGQETPMLVQSRDDYMLLSDKTTEGTPTQLWYDKQLTNGTMYIWPEPDDTQVYIKFTAQIPLQDVDNLSNNLEVAQEWYEAVAWNLAVRLFPKYQRPIDPLVAAMAVQFLDDAMIEDSENASTQIQIEMR